MVCTAHACILGIFLDWNKSKVDFVIVNCVVCTYPPYIDFKPHSIYT